MASSRPLLKLGLVASLFSCGTVGDTYWVLFWERDVGAPWFVSGGRLVLAVNGGKQRERLPLLVGGQGEAWKGVLPRA